MQAERARRIEEKRQRRKYDRQMQRRQEYVTRCREELEDRRRRVGCCLHGLRRDLDGAQ